jgi:hypothetical protein
MESFTKSYLCSCGKVLHINVIPQFVKYNQSIEIMEKPTNIEKKESPKYDWDNTITNLRKKSKKCLLKDANSLIQKGTTIGYSRDNLYFDDILNEELSQETKNKFEFKPRNNIHGYYIEIKFKGNEKKYI